MIKKYLIAVLLAISFYSYAQENKNKFMINGNVNYLRYHDRYKYNFPEYAYDYVNRTIIGGVNFGYFISNNFAIGISGAINKTTWTSNSNGQMDYLYEFHRTNNYTACGIFSRYNHAPHGSKFGVFLQLNSNYVMGNITNTTIHQEPGLDLVTTKSYSKYTKVNTSLSPGIIYFINSKFSLESSLGSVYYNIGKSEEDNTYFINKASEFGISFSLRTINVGFSYYFGGKKS